MKRLNILAFLLLAAPLVILFVALRHAAINVPYWDQWELVGLLAKNHQHALTFFDLSAQHNEHRIFFPRLVMLGLASLSGWDTRWEIWAGALMLLATTGLLARAHLRFETSASRGVWLFAPVLWLLLSFRQSHNLFWGWQIQIFMCQFFAVVACLALATHRRWTALGIAVVASIAASYSFAAGLGLWPVGIACLVAYRSWRQLAVWLLASAAVLTSYFVSYVKPGGHPSIWAFLEQPVHALRVFAEGLGGTLGWSPTAATVMGTIVLALTAYLAGLAVQGHLDATRFAIALPFLLFSAATAALVVLGRAGFDAEYGFASRYTTLCGLGLFGLHQGILATRPAVRQRLFTVFLALAVVGAGSSIHAGLADVDVTRGQRLEMRATLLSFEDRTDTELAQLYPQGAIVRERAPVLRHLGLSVFRPRR
ncbi:MAG: hypothetical protein ACKVPX_02720 [Myxococcaceae bacterium]